MNVYRTVGYVLFLGLIIAAIVVDTPIDVFIDIPSILIIAGGSFAFTLIATSLTGIYVWQAATLGFILSAVLGEGIGLIKMLHYLDDASSIGPAMAVCLLTTLYALILTGLVASRIDKSVVETGNYDHASQIRLISMAYPFYAMFMAALSFFLLLFALASLA